MKASEEQKSLVKEWGRGPVEAVPGTCIHELFETQARQTPEAVAVGCGEERLCYRELNSRANQLAHHLRRLGVRPETRVALCVERSPEMMVGLLGILKAGGAYVPLDPEYPSERLAFMLEDASVQVLLTQEGLTGRLPTSGTHVVCLDHDWPMIATQPEEDPKSGVGPDNLAYVIYTSGSTGRPKGTLVHHLGLTNYLAWCQQAYPFVAGAGSPVHSSISFDLTVTTLFVPLLTGGWTHLWPKDPDVGLLTAIPWNETDCNVVKVIPTHLQLLSQQLSPEMTGHARAVIIGGENLLAENITFWEEHAVGTVLVNEYGPTETVVGCCVYKIPPGKHRTGSVPIGRPIINTQLCILDKHLHLAPIGVSGELYIGGAGVSRGYHNQPGLTAERFIPNPFSDEPGARLYKTGDLARYLSDGNIEFLGRIDHQVKVLGHRIELGEVEATLLQCPEVAQAVVVAREDTPGHKRLVAYIVPCSDSMPSRDTLVSFLEERLPRYMVPRLIVFLSDLPRTPNGKVDRRALPLPEVQYIDTRTGFVAPQKPLEREIARAFAEVLGVDRVGLYDNFFDLGGDSLLLMRLARSLLSAHSVSLPVLKLFRVPTVSGVVHAVEAYKRGEHESMVAAWDALREAEAFLEPDITPEWLSAADVPSPPDLLALEGSES